MTQKDVIQVKEGVEAYYLIPPSWVNEKARATIKSNLCLALRGRKHFHIENVTLQVLT